MTANNNATLQSSPVCLSATVPQFSRLGDRLVFCSLFPVPSSLASFVPSCLCASPLFRFRFGLFAAPWGSLGGWGAQLLRRCGNVQPNEPRAPHLSPVQLLPCSVPPCFTTPSVQSKPRRVPGSMTIAAAPSKRPQRPRASACDPNPQSV